MRSEEYKPAMMIMIASGKRAIRTFVRILKFARRPISVVPPTGGIRQRKAAIRSLLGDVGRLKLAESFQREISAQGSLNSAAMWRYGPDFFSGYRLAGV